jgi:site-specific recombinase XerD
MKNKPIKVRRGNVTVTINQTRQKKKGRVYTAYVVSDYSNGSRKQWPFADIAEAKAKAVEIADAINQGLSEKERWEIGLRLEIRKALEALEPTGVSLLRATELFVQGLGIIGSPDQFLPACSYFKSHGPSGSVEAILLKDGVAKYQAYRNWISFKRRKTETCYFGALVAKFGEKLFYDLTATEIEDLLKEKGWSAKTRNDFLTCVAALYRYGQRLRWTARDHKPTWDVKRLRVTYGEIKIYQPEEVERLFNRLAERNPELVPTMALWCFAGIRIAEIGRMTWPMISAAFLLSTPLLDLPAKITKTGRSRIVRIPDNLRAWLQVYRQDSGTIVPEHWLKPTKTALNRLDELGRYVERRTGVKWKTNAPRHSFATYAFKLWKDAGEVVKTMGTSLQKFEQHYWSRSDLVTDEAAQAYFAIMPANRAKIVPMPASGSTAGSVDAASAG